MISILYEIIRTAYKASAEKKSVIYTRKINALPDALTPDELRYFLQLGKNKTYEMLDQGIIKSIRIGKQYRIPKQYLIDYLNTCYDNCVDGLSHIASQKGA